MVGKLRAAMWHPLVTCVGVFVVAVSMVGILVQTHFRTGGGEDGLLGVLDPRSFQLATGPLGRGMGIRRSFLERLELWLPYLGLTLLLLGIASCIWFVMRRNPMEGGQRPRRLALRLPVIGNLRGLALRAHFASTLGMLLSRQVSLVHALQLSAATVDEVETRREADKMAAAAAEGQSLPDSLAAGELLGPAMVYLAGSSAAPTGVGQALQDVAGYYRQRLEFASERAAQFLPLLGLFLAGLVVLCFALAFLGPAFRASMLAVWF